MALEASISLPGWLIDGALGGAVLSVVVAVLFWLLVRAFPESESSPGPRQRGTDRRRAEIREYLRSIDEPFVEGSVVAGQPVAFYLPVRDVAITFDARAYYRLARTDVEPVLVEHELPGVALGARLPFETPTVDAGDGSDATDPVAAAYDVLEVPAGSSAEETRRAYRRKVKRVHPDHGGDREEFRRVREAYATVRNRAS